MLGVQEGLMKDTQGLNPRGEVVLRETPECKGGRVGKEELS